MKTLAAWTMAALLLAAAGASAATLTVEANGTGEYVDIGDAVAAASEGDTILIGPGIYAESLVLNIALTLQSTDGPASTWMDGQNSFRLILIDGGFGTVIRGIGFRNGETGTGAGVFARNGSTVAIEDCVFLNSRATFDAGAVHSRHPGTVVAIRDCWFEGNVGLQKSGAISVILSSQMTIERCTFLENSSGIFSGGIIADHSVLNISECTFRNNTTTDVSGAVYYYFALGALRSNTFHGNTSPGRATVVLHNSSGTLFERNLVTGEAEGFGLQYIGTPGTHSCNVFWDNAAGAIDGDTADASEPTADPGYCNPGAGDFTVASLGPASPLGSPCDALIGAFSASCQDPVAVRDASWSALKWDYRALAP